MKLTILRVVSRMVLGAIFIAGPLATALHLAPEPVLPPEGAAFITALGATGYMLPLLWSTEIAGGILLLSGVLAPLGLVLLAPVIVNIVAFHLFLAPQGLPLAVVVCTLEILLAWQYRHAFAPILPTRRLQQANTADQLEVRHAGL